MTTVIYYAVPPLDNWYHVTMWTSALKTPFSGVSLWVFIMAGKVQNILCIENEYEWFKS